MLASVERRPRNAHSVLARLIDCDESIREDLFQYPVPWTSFNVVIGLDLRKILDTSRACQQESFLIEDPIISDQSIIGYIIDPSLKVTCSRLFQNPLTELFLRSCWDMRERAEPRIDEYGPDELICDNNA